MEITKGKPNEYIRGTRGKISSPVAPPGARMAISFQSDEDVLRNLREKLRNMTEKELIEFGKTVRGLSEGSTRTSNPFKRQLEEAIAEWKRRKQASK